MAIAGVTIIFRTAGRMCSGHYNVLIVSLLSLLLTSQVSGTSCPTYVKTAASDCFREYRMQLLSIQQSDHTLFSGVNVELLRSFCTSYKEALQCVQGLIDSCPPELDAQITDTLVKQDAYGAREELMQLCRDDMIFEVYARNQNCLESVGPNSEKCFEDIMHTSVRLMRRIDTVPLADLCGDINDLLRCINVDVLRVCGQEAAGIVEILVKPMIRRSTQCDYTIPTSTKKPTDSRVTKATMRERTGSGSNQQYVSDGKNGSPSIRPTGVNIVTFLFIIYLLFKS